MMEKMDGMSIDLVKENLELLKDIFPVAFTEGKINIEVLKKLIGDEIDSSKEQYITSWNGKTDSIKIAQMPSTATLRPCKEKSKNWDDTNNYYFEGDNLEVLKQIQKTYFGKIKMIYIDPPYNTGKDFIYKDDYTDSVSSYIEQTKQEYSSNPNTNGRRHSNWMSLMYPRLLLSRNLLRDDGVIFISIDDNEIANLRKLCDEVFGENNYIECFHVQVRYDNKQTRDIEFLPVMEYVLMYAKDKTIFRPNLPYADYNYDKFVYEIIEKGTPKSFKNGNDRIDVFKKGEWEIIKHDVGSDKYLKETWITGSIYSDISYGKIYQRIVEPRVEIDGKGSLYKIYGRGEDGLGYRYYTNPQKESATKGKTFSGVPLVRKAEVEEGTAKQYKPISNYYDFSADFGNIRHEGGVPFNSGKKPTKMLKEFIDISNLQEGDIVLDFFSGSGSTAHAVMLYSDEKKMPLQFIMVQIPEQDNENDEFSTICDLGEERIRRSGEKIKDEWLKEKNKKGLLADESEDFSVDIGFKVFTLDSTNINPWDNTNEYDEASLFDTATVFKLDRSNEDVLYEVMLKYGVFDQPASEVEINGKTMYRVGQRHMIVCLEDKIDDSDISEICKLEPRVVVFKEDGFKDDNAKINAEYNLKKSGVEDVKAI